MNIQTRNIDSIEFYSNRLGVIKKLIVLENYNDALKATRALIEAAGMVYIKKVYDKDLYNSQLSIIAMEFENLNENELSDMYKDINGTLNMKYESKKIDENDVYSLIYKLDDLLGLILEKREDIFK